MQAGGLLLVGCGKMGGAMLAGWMAAGSAPSPVMVVEPSPAPGAVPEPLRLAMRHLVAFWFANRGDDEAAPAKLPAQVAALLAPYRAWRLA